MLIICPDISRPVFRYNFNHPKPVANLVSSAAEVSHRSNLAVGEPPCALSQTYTLLPFRRKLESGAEVAKKKKKEEPSYKLNNFSAW